MRSGHIVVCDRYLLSSWAYQAMDCPLAWVREINRFAPSANLTFWLEIEPTVAMQRITVRGQPRDVYETLRIQERVAAAYRSLWEERPESIRVDGGAPVDEVTRQLLDHCVRTGL